MKLYFPNLFLFITLSTFGQGFHEHHSELSDFVEITNSQLSTCTTVTLENDEFLENMTDGGGELTGFFTNNHLIKIELWVGISYGNFKFDYYFQDSELHYIVETFQQYSYDVETDTWNYSKLEQTFRGDYLFQPTFDYETLGHNRFENDELDPEKVLREETMEYVKLLNKKKNAR